MAKRMLTESNLRAEHARLNTLCFEGILPSPTFAIAISKEKRPKWAKGEWAEGEYHANGYGKGMILVDPRAPDWRAVLAHEMVHQWQDLLGFRLDHYRVFKEWCHHIEQLTGLIP